MTLSASELDLLLRLAMGWVFGLELGSLWAMPLELSLEGLLRLGWRLGFELAMGLALLLGLELV